MYGFDNNLDIFIDEQSYVFESLKQQTAFYEFTVQFGCINLSVNLSIN